MLATYRPEDLRIDLAIGAGMQGLAYAWRGLDRRTLELGFHIEEAEKSFLWNSDKGIVWADDVRGYPYLAFKNGERFLNFIDQGKPSFRLGFSFLRPNSILRFLMVASRLSPLLRGGNRQWLENRDWLAFHCELSIYTAIGGLSVLMSSVPGWNPELKQFAGKTLGFFCGADYEPLAGLTITAAFCVLIWSSLKNGI